ncbi:hypothetical protein, partial [Pseudoalteromonas sp. SIMBA_162]|uniref:hypothetical protein n=1 Tax=Pseudoalteromonas sp. SIMBA_162 TaxID=3080867 RepID=UPI00397CA0BF
MPQTTEISVPQGDLGTFTEGNNLLNYSITTDGEMSTITERVNGVVVGTKNLTNGEVTTVSVPSETWGSISLGKNTTLTIEMGGEVFTYTFKKLLGDNSSLAEVTEGVQ